MSDTGKRQIRRSIAAPDRGLQVIEGGRGGGGPSNGDQAAPEECPVVALGHLDGMLYFLDVRGQKRMLTARQLGSRHDLLQLFMGDDGWLRKRFPKIEKKTSKAEDGSKIEEEIVVDFRINGAAAFFQKSCGLAGLFGDHVILRRPGVWPLAGGQPVVHCGDQILIDGIWHPAGTRTDAQVWAAASPRPRPGAPCDASIGRSLQAAMKDLWLFREPGGEIALLGVLGTAYYAGAAPWRSCGFIIGGGGSGKSRLLKVLSECAPMRYFSNDTSKAGLEQGLDGCAMPTFLDEAADQDDQRGARRLLDMVLTASGAEGTKGSRGGIDGKGRKIEVMTSILMASVNPPDMKETHLGRFVIVSLEKPSAGADHTDQMTALEERMRAAGPALWGRALAGWDRYLTSRRAFRAALGEVGCAAREMDQLGAILAGWWVLTEEGAPNHHESRTGVSALTSFVRRADDISAESSARHMVSHLLSSLVQMDRSTDRESVGSLINYVLADLPHERVSAEYARRVLRNYGVRVVRATDVMDSRERPVPRLAMGAGVWFSRQNTPLRMLFANTPYEGDRWQHELRRLETARLSVTNVRIGPGLPPGRAIWVGAEELGFEAGPDPERDPDPPDL